MIVKLTTMMKIGNKTFIYFKPCNFIMGHISGDKFAKPCEKNRKVTLTKGFYIQTTPVTTKQYFEFLKDTGYAHDYRIEIWDGNEWIVGPTFMEANKKISDEYPIVGVSYIDAKKYIKWASKKFNKKFRLPTEAEFELAARSGCKCKVVCENAMSAAKRKIIRKENVLPSTTWPVSFRKSVKTKRGLIGMHGSLWQWCSDWFFDYNDSDILNPKGPKTKPDYAPWNNEKWLPGKVIRGGSFSYPFQYSRCSNRHYSKTNDRNYNLGFRLCI